MASLTTDIQTAITALTQGKPVALPTETVYGLAALADDTKAVQAVFEMKNRPLTHPLIVHVADLSLIKDRLAFVPAYVEAFAQAFWPGPLTMVFNIKASAFDPLVSAGQPTVAVRIPSHPLMLELLQMLNKPIVAPSANAFGRVSPTTAEHVLQSFAEQNLLVLDGGRSQVGIESTIIDATQDGYYSILRQGMICESELRAVDSRLLESKGERPRVSGDLKTHYQPQKPLFYFSEQAALNTLCNKFDNVFVIAKDKPEQDCVKSYHPLPLNAKEAAYQLYYLLREADQSEAEVILIEMPIDNEQWAGVIERIKKAGSAI